MSTQLELPFQEKKYELTPDQQIAFDYLIQFCQRKTEHDKVLLMGYAGTGKTFTINRVVEAVKELNPSISFGMTAPTHKAVGQLYKHSEMKDSLSFGTIHSFLGLRQVQKPNPKKPNEYIEIFERDPEAFNQPRKIDGIRVLVLDEASMLPDELYEYVDDEVRAKKIVVIFMGDGLQIPPVGKSIKGRVLNAIPFSPEQRESRRIKLLELTQIVRQGAGNPIINYSLAIREQYKNQSILFDFSELNSNGIEVIRKEKPTDPQSTESGLPRLRQLFEQYFCTPDFEADADYVKVIAWRNATVDYFNKEIRLLIHKTATLPKIIESDKVVLSKPYVIKKVIVPNNEELLIKHCEVISIPIEYTITSNVFNSQFERLTDGTGDLDLSKRKVTKDFKVYRCDTITPDGKEWIVNILHEDSEQDYEELRKKLKSAAMAKETEFFDKKEMWKEYFALEKKFCWVVYNYALTVHKAQGSTYDYCISMEWDIDTNYLNEERNRIRYVAATRARNKLYIVK